MSDTLARKYRSLVTEIDKVDDLGRKDSPEAQKYISNLIKQLDLVSNFVERLDLFSENEAINEINPAYIQYLALDYYKAHLLSQSIASPSSDELSLDFKVMNLENSKQHLVQFLVKLKSMNLLTKSQTSRIDSFKELSNPTFEELTQVNISPAIKRAEKIENYKLEKQLNNKLVILNNYYNEEMESFDKLDEESIRLLFIDQLKLFSIKAFNLLESVGMELSVLSQRQSFEEKPLNKDTTAPIKPVFGPDGYTPKIEHVSNTANIPVSQLVDKKGKILQPFKISNRQELLKKVQGTGQVLPSMTVDEYLDYELANGKMAKEQPNDQYKDEDATDDSDEELEKRKWDDWKDDNPKGSGNTMGNIG